MGFLEVEQEFIKVSPNKREPAISWNAAYVQALDTSTLGEYAGRCLGQLRRHFLLTSVGALCDDTLHQDLMTLAEEGVHHAACTKIIIC